MITFEKALTCRHCSKFLKGLIHQGYRCKSCDICVHKGCISSTGRCKQLSPAPPVCDRQLSEFYWFAGTMARDTASAKLEPRKVGTYLLRVRPQGASNASETMYALSLKWVECLSFTFVLLIFCFQDIVLFTLIKYMHHIHIQSNSFHMQNRWAYDKTHENQFAKWEWQHSILFVIASSI